MDWQPQEEPLRQLIGYLSESLSGADANVRKKAEMMLKQAETSPDVDNYLCFLLTNDPTATATGLDANDVFAARTAGGIKLKNDVKTHYSAIPPASRSYIKATIFTGLQDSNAQIRAYTGNAITEIVRQGGIMDWPEVLPSLFHLVGNESGTTPVHAQEGAMSALHKVCEDNKRILNKQHGTQRPLDVVVMKLLQYTSNSSPKVKADAIASINCFLPEKPGSLVSNLDALLGRLFELASDRSDEVRKQICRAFVQVAEIAPAKIAPHMEGLVDYMLTQQRSVEDPELAQDAAEFWLCVGEDKHLRDLLGPYLDKIVPVLLECMVYSEDDVMRLEIEAEDAEAADDEQEIKPQFASSKTPRNQGLANGAANGTSAGPVTDGDDLSEGELEEYDEDDQEDDPEDVWNLRKCSAASLDVLASYFHGPIFEVTLPYLKTNLTHQQWPNREAAVLAIGAIAEGCMDSVEPHLPDLVPYLILLLGDDQPIVRQITCWSLGRYAGWAAHLSSDGQQQFFLPMMDGILKRMLDSNKKVQEAAASAFAQLEEKSGDQLRNPQYCEVIARQFAECFSRYQSRNMYILYDCTQTLAENVGSTLQKPELVHCLMPAILKRWEKVADNSRETFPLLECLAYVATALGNTFSPYAETVLTRSVRILYSNLQDMIAAKADPSLDEPEKDFLITTLDLISAILQSIDESQSARLIREAPVALFDLLIACLEDSNSEVRQSAYALLGDSAIYVFETLQPSIPRLFPILLNELDLSRPESDALETGFFVTNNACWSCGEICTRASASDISPFVEALSQRLFTILVSTTNPPSLLENAAIALGRLGCTCPDFLAPHLANFAFPFLRIMHGIQWTDEKADAMRGMSELVVRNPQALEHCLVEYLVECANASPPPAPEARESGEDVERPYRVMGQAINMYRNMMPGFPDFVRQNLKAEDGQRLFQLFPPSKSA